MNLRDLKQLCDRYVPMVARHEASLSRSGHAPVGCEWWYAHEIGHLLTALHEHHETPLFGMDDSDIDLSTEHELRCRELVAIDISRRLLNTVGRKDLAEDEHDDTDSATMYWDDNGRVKEILREYRCLRLPRTRRGLGKKLRRVLRAGRKATGR